MQFSQDICSYTQSIKRKAHAPQGFRYTKRCQRIQRQGASEMSTFPADTSQPQSFVHIASYVPGRENDSQSAWRGKGEQVRTDLPVSGLINAIDDKQQTASIR